MNPLHFTRNVRSLNRLRQILAVATQQGFGHVVARMNLGRFVPLWVARRMRRAPEPDTPRSIGRRLTEACVELGPTFVKFAQLMSTRPDIVPADVLEELRKLQDDVPPFDGQAALAIIREELGCDPMEHFDSLDPAPIASGSIGQVHRARTKKGDDVVIKVRRPGIEETIALDMQLLKWLSESLESLMPELAVYRPALLVAELEQLLTRELDYIHEASATTRFARAFGEAPGMHIPRVHWEFTTPRILTLEAIPGVNVDEALTDEGLSFDRRAAARRLADCFLQQVFELGAFHADPHPGNVLIDSAGTVGLIDYGQVGTITDETMTQIVVMVYAATSKEVGVIIDALADLGALGAETDRRQLERALRVLLDKYWGLPIKRLDLAQLMNEFADVVRHYDVIIPRDVLMLFKSLGLVASITSRLDPDLVLLDLLEQRLALVLRQRLSPRRLGKDTAVWGWHLVNILRHAPGQLREGLRRVAAGGWRVRIRHENIDRLINELDRSSNRLAFSIVIAAIIVGSSVVVSADSKLAFFGISINHFGIVGYLFAGILGLGLSWAIFRSGRLH